MSARTRPELVKLPQAPTVLKISELSSGIYIIKRNLPFGLSHMAKIGIKSAFICAGTGKSIMTIMGKESAEVREMIKRFELLVIQKFPQLSKHVSINVQATLHWGYSGPEPSLTYVADIPRLVETLDSCGFSDVPIRTFQIMLDYPSNTIITFIRKEDMGFIASQIGTKPYTVFSEQQLAELIQKNPVLQRMKCFICQTAVATGKWMTCRLPSGASCLPEDLQLKKP